MKDTRSSVEALVRERMMCLSGQDRLRMGASMFEAARRLVMASLRDGTPSEVREGIFMRFYGGDFDGARRKRILERLMGDD